MIPLKMLMDIAKGDVGLKVLRGMFVCHMQAGTADRSQSADIYFFCSISCAQLDMLFDSERVN
jgi:hypothetical protein